MVSLFNQLQSDLKSAQLNQDAAVLGVLRMLLSAIKNKEIEKRTKSGQIVELSEEEIVGVIFTETKKRREAAEQYRVGNRPELAEKEINELNILSKYLPERLSEDEIRKITKQTIAGLQAAGLQDIGRVMSQIMPKVKGKADGGLVNKIVKEELS